MPESEDLVSPERARIYAGTSTWLWLDLIALGLVRPVRRGALDLYSKAAIGQLIARLRKYAGPDVDPALYFSISQASRASGIRPAMIVKMILERDLRYVATDPFEKGFASILLDITEIGGIPKPEYKGDFSISEAAQRLHVRMKCIGRLIKLGFLEPDRRFHNVSVKSVQSFGRRMISLSEIAAREGMAPEAVQAELTLRGVKHAVSISGTDEVFYRRSDI